VATNRDGWHRVFHPLCGSDLGTLLTLLARNGPPSTEGAAPLAIAVATALCRLPFTAAERAWVALALRRRGAAAPPAVPGPVFIVGHMRSGTTHLHNLLARSSLFATVPPVLAGMPWEALGLARLVRPLVGRYLPENRLIDGVRVEDDSPTEDEIALANMLPLSYYHAIYFPRHFERNYRAGLFIDPARIGSWLGTLRYYVRKMSMLDPDRPLLLKNPTYTAHVGLLAASWPDARFIHIYRNPYVVFESTKRALATVLRELSLQRHGHVRIDDIVLDAYPRLMDRLLRDAGRLPRDRIVHVRFEDLETEPLREIERIFAALRLGDAAAARPRIGAYLASIRHYRKTGYDFPRESTDAVARHWGEFVARFGYLPPGVDRPAA
jgi:hypothetical protein